jgi:hypothetical protein
MIVGPVWQHDIFEFLTIFIFCDTHVKAFADTNCLQARAGRACNGEIHTRMAA